MRHFMLSALLAFAACGGCDDDSKNAAPNGDPNATNTDAGPNNATDGGANNGSDAGNNGGGGDMGSREDYCEGDGPPVLNPGTANEICTGEIAAVSFRFAMCTCEGFVTSNLLQTSSIDSATQMSGRSASVGTNGKFDSSSDVMIGGSLWASGDGGMTMGGGATVEGDLRSGGDIVSGAELSVGNDSDVEGNLVVQADMSVTGTLRQRPDNDRTIQGQLAAGATVEEEFDVANPCDCSDDLKVPVVAIVDGLEASNDNDSIGFDADAIQNINQDTTLDVPCGRFYLSGINGSGSVTINVDGRVALFIGGDLALSGTLAVNLADGAELDLFIRGNVTLANDVTIGDPDRPAATRIYVGGTGTIAVSAGVSLNANVYAPDAEVVLSGDTEIRGSVFARRLATSGALTIVYDEAVLEAGEGCSSGGGGTGGDPNSGMGGGSCDSCRDCRNQACVDGMCGMDCTSNEDCCAPLICQAGSCQVIM